MQKIIKFFKDNPDSVFYVLIPIYIVFCCAAVGAGMAILIKLMKWGIMGD